MQINIYSIIYQYSYLQKLYERINLIYQEIYFTLPYMPRARVYVSMKITPSSCYECNAGEDV